MLNRLLPALPDMRGRPAGLTTLMGSMIIAVCVLLGGVQNTAIGQVSVTSDLSLDRTTAPGTTYEETIEIRNDSEQPEIVRLYARDYSFAADGSNTYGEPGSMPRSSAGWLTFGPDQRTIQAGETVTVGVTVNVPSAGSETQELTGTYWSIVMVEAVEQAADSTSGQFQVQSKIRYGVQMITHIQDTGAPKITFQNPTLTTRDNGDRVLQVDLSNVGNRAAVPEVHVELYGSDGSKQSELSASNSRIYPGTSVRKTFPLEDVPGGTYTALVVADAGTGSAFGAKYTIEI